MQWLQTKRVCPCFDPSWTKASTDCCPAEGDPTTCTPGCEEDRIVIGGDEMMLNSDMGLYYTFTSNGDGIPGGCPGLEAFNTTMMKKNWKYRYPRVPPEDKHGGLWTVEGKGANAGADNAPACPYNDIEAPPG